MSADRGVEAVLARLAAPHFRQLAVDAVVAELRGLHGEMQARAIREGGRVDLTLDDIEARIAQAQELLP